MEKTRLYQILNVLLLPYREKEFVKPDGDVIADVRYSFLRLRNRVYMTASQRKKYEDEYYKSEKRLQEFLQRHTDWYIRRTDDLRLLLNLFFPETGVPELSDDEMEAESYFVIDQLYIKNLYEIAKSLLTFRDGKSAIRTWINESDEKDIFRYPHVFDKVEIWNLLGRMMATDILIVAFFVEIGLTEVFYLDGQTGGILLADKTLEKIMQKGLAETHLHFNAGAEFNYLWQEVMDLRKWEEPLLNDKKYKEYCEKNRIPFPFPVYRLLWGEYLENVNSRTFRTFLREEYMEEDEKLLSELMHCLLTGKTDEFTPEWKKMYSNFIWKWKNWYTDQKEEFLFSTVYRKFQKYNTYSEMIFLFKSLIYFNDHPDAVEERRLFLQYIRIKNIYFSDFVQSNQIQGLENLGTYYGNMSDRFYNAVNALQRYDVIFKSIAHNTYLRKLEIRIAPGIKIYSDDKYYDYENVRYEIRKRYLIQIREVLQVYRKHMLSNIGLIEWTGDRRQLEPLDILYRDGKNALPTLGIVIHFIKQDFVDNRIGDTCWIQKKSEINSYSKHIRVWREALVKCARVLEELRSEIPYFAEYVVGIDATSGENRTEPWVFAPLYAGIRNRRITRPALKDLSGNIMKINNIGFTYHVGEEYRHLLSGLRHIDEVIEHFHYKAGDRLGHAIALGTDIKQWTEENETVIIPIQEHMENLIWLWGNLIYRRWGIGINAEALEGRILELAKTIYGNINGLTVHMLYEAYMSKFRLNYEAQFERLRVSPYILDHEDSENCREGGWHHFCRFYNVSQPYGIMWTADKIFCTNFCPLFYSRLMQPIFVHVELDEWKILSKVQDYVLQKVEKNGIYVEVNPTSNLAVGDTKTLFSPHILNLNSKGLASEKSANHEVLVTVNSDDPVIFNTNSENELSYVYHALTYQGYKKESVLEWIDKVRGMGMDSSFVKNEKKPSQQIMEITELINYIDDILMQRKEK